VLGLKQILKQIIMGKNIFFTCHAKKKKAELFCEILQKTPYESENVT